MEPTREVVEQLQDLSSRMIALSKRAFSEDEVDAIMEQGIALSKRLPETSLDKARLLIAIQHLGQKAGLFSFHQTILVRS